MPAARLHAAGLLLLVRPWALALRTLAPHGEPAGAPDEGIFRRTKVATLAQLKELTKRQIQSNPDLASVSFHGEQHGEQPMRANNSANSSDFAGLNSTFWVNRSCFMTESECKFSDLPRGESTSIHPGGKTTCLFGDNFSFQVFPGALDRLAIHLGGGGACWDEVTTLGVPACVTTAYRTPLMGFFNQCGGPSPFEGYTAIYVPMCGGDLHAGNVTRPWKREDGRPIAAKGYWNTRSVLDWVLKNMGSELSHFALMGDSAGSIGTQVWAATMLRELRPRQARILGESYIGVLPSGFQEMLWVDLNICEAFFKGVSPTLFEKCTARNLTVQEVYASTMEEFPDVIFGHLNSKHDSVQRLFFDVATTTGRLWRAVEWCGDVKVDDCDLSGAPAELTTYSEPMSEGEYLKRAGEIVKKYSAHPNYFSYFMSGDQHSMSMWVFGRCYLEYLKHEPNQYWIGGSRGRQRLNVMSWALDFFGNGTNQSSGCDQGLQNNSADDYCFDFMFKKRKV